MILRVVLLLLAMLQLVLPSSITPEDATAYYAISSWSQNSLDRLNFLYDEDDWANLRSEFELADKNGDGTLSVDEAIAKLEEFNDSEKINEFVQYCEENSEGGECDFISYAFARGAYDRVGVEFDENELDMRQSIFTESIERLIRDADVDDLAVLGIRIDPEGNIIDEL